MTRTIFVYGTLKTGYRLNDVLVDAGSKKLAGFALTCERYTMLAAGYPVVMEKPQQARVAGELWRVPESLVPHLDRIEVAYTRQVVRVRFGLHVVEAEMYFGRPDVWDVRKMARHVPSGANILEWPYGLPAEENMKGALS